MQFNPCGNLFGAVLGPRGEWRCNRQSHRSHKRRPHHTLPRFCPGRRGQTVSYPVRRCASMTLADRLSVVRPAIHGNKITDLSDTYGK